jgi:hypothetical protein
MLFFCARTRFPLGPRAHVEDIMSSVAMEAWELARAGSEPFTPTGLEFRLARQSEDRLGAFQLIHKAYVRSGLGEASPLGMRATPYQILPTSQIFVGLLREEVVSTVSLIGDGELGLPMDVVFRREIQPLREAGHQVAEVSCLADRRQSGRRFLDSFKELTRLMAQFARYEGIESLLITVHPRHAPFYTRYLGFTPLSDRIADCPHVQGNPAIALRLEFARIDRDRPACWDDYFSQWMEREELRPYTVSDEEMTFLQSLVTAQEMYRLANFIKPEPTVGSGVLLPLSAASLGTVVAGV